MHVYFSKDQGQFRKRSYDVWEYGAKPDVQYCSYGGDLEDALQVMRNSNISKAVAANLFSRSSLSADLPYLKAVNNAIQLESFKYDFKNVGQALKDLNFAFCRMFKNRPEFIPFVAMDPSVLSPEELEAHFKDLVKNYGAKGIKVHPVSQQFFMNDKHMWPVYETCSKLGTPILCHSGPAREGPQYADPRTCAEILDTFPQLKLILAHLGGGNLWRKILEVARTYPNVYFDCSEIIEWIDSPNGPSAKQLASIMRDIGAGRILMGSDFPWYDPGHCIKIIQSLPLLSEDEKSQILGRNFLRLVAVS
jgi:uncharacterized protein